MFNSSLSKGIVPTEWKFSNVTPVFKGNGDPSCFANYRPISLLSLPSKVLARIVHNRLLDCLLSNILSNRQFGFRPGSSTQEALLCATSDWSHCLDRGTSVAAVSLDLSKAFDRVPHCQFLSALINIGVSGPLLAWFRSYLSGRTQRVVVDGCSSEVHPVTSGVPQGSILGPLLFSIYMNSITNTQFHQVTSLILYADDILLYRPVSTSDDVALMQSDVAKVVDWLYSAGLSLNAGKSNVIIFSCKFSRPVIHIVIYNTVLPIVDSIRFLGHSNQ